MFACKLAKCKFTRPPCGVAPVGDMFQHKIDKIFRDPPIVFGITDDILIVGSDADVRDHSRPMRQVMQIWCCEN